MPKLEVPIVDIADSQPHALEHEGQPIVLYRQGDTISAYVDRCPHAGWKLSEGDLRDGVIECAGHSWEFNVGDGKCITVPAHCLTRLRTQLHDATVEIEWDDEPGD